MNLDAYMALLLTSLSTFASDRTVSRELKSLDQLNENAGEELETGRYTLLSTGLRDTRNIPGAAVHGGTWDIVIIGQIRLVESATGVAVEAAESQMFAQISDWLNSPIDDEINCLEVISMTQSQQLETPYGWIAIKIEVTL